jgi:RNA polymerase sigma-70 factor, ECF subfamily
MENKSKLEKMLTGLSNDDKSALEALFNHFYPRLYRFSLTFLKVEEGIDDILQEVFLKIWLNRKKITNADTFNAYIFTITRNLLLNEIRNRLNSQKAMETLFEKSVAVEFQLSGQIEFQELRDMVSAIVAGLPDRQQEIFNMSRSEGLSHREIAQKLQIAEKTVEYHIHQVIAILRKRLRELGISALLYFMLFF